MQTALIRAFTLIELLIVVAIIAILAAVAMPNFLEAQTRAKVARAKSDLTAVTTGLEAYAAENNRYPLNDGLYNVLPVELTTPVAFLASHRLIDPFCGKELHAHYGELARYYTYDKIDTHDEAQTDALIHRNAPVEAIDDDEHNPGALKKYGKWRLVSNGPDRIYSDEKFTAWQPVLKGADIAYDPTNGSVSFGNILRTQSRCWAAFAE